MDIEIKASGLTRQMEKDLLVEMGMDTEEVEEEEEEQEECEEETAKFEDAIATQEIADDIGILRQEVDKSCKIDMGENSEIKPPDCISHKDFGSNLEENVCDETLMDRLMNILDKFDERNASQTYNSDEDEIPELIEAPRLAKSHQAKEFNDNRSVRSYASASTIAPEVIKMKMKSALEKRDKKNSSRRALVRGEASATARSRRENRDNIKQSTGIWGWE